MDRLHSWKICVGMAALLLFAACSQDGLTEQGTPLPVGQYPLELTVGGLEAVAVPASAPSTRATVDGIWESNMQVAVQVDGEGVKAYSVTPTGGGKTATLSSADPFYWTNTSDKKTVTAWHPYSGTYPETWTVKADQNATDNNSITNYQASDLIKGELQNLTFPGRDTKMTFEHQTAKVEIKLTATDGFTLGDAKVKLLNVADVENNGSEITPYRPDDTEQTYLALLGEQNIKANTNFIQVTANGTDYYYKHDADKELNAGTAYTYNITVKAEGLDVTVGESMNWTTDGAASGEGSVTLPTEIHLSDGPIEITDGGNYLITGTGTQTVTINGNATVTFSDVNITTNDGAPIHVTGGSPTLHFNGENTLSCNTNDWGGIAVENIADITLTGDAENTKLTINNSGERLIGIGTPIKDGYSSDFGSTCGDITISNLHLKINSDAVSGIGAAYNSTCGNIEIDDCKLNITTTTNAACIGASVGRNASTSRCGNITLRDCEIEQLYAEYADIYNFYPAAIGCSAGNAHCGDINIYLHEMYETIDEFLEKIIVDKDTDKIPDKVGVGVPSVDDGPSIGTVTWYDHQGKKIGEGTRK